MFVPGSAVYDADTGHPRPISVYVVPNISREQPQVQYAFRPRSGEFRLPHVLRCWGAQVFGGGGQTVNGGRGVGGA